MLEILCRHLAVIMFGMSQVTHCLREKAVKIIGSICSLLEIVMKNNRLGDNFPIKYLVLMVWNKETKCLKAAQGTCDRKRCICYIWPV
jgi:hypothetical protein